MRWILASALFGLFLALSAGTAPAQDRPIDLSSKGAKVFRGASGQGLTLPSQAAPRAVTVSFLRSQGHLPETIGSLVATGESRVARKGITHLRFAQEVEGLTVYGTYVRAAVNDRGELVHLIENLATPPAGGLVRTVKRDRTRRNLPECWKCTPTRERST